MIQIIKKAKRRTKNNPQISREETGIYGEVIFENSKKFRVHTRSESFDKKKYSYEKKA